MSNFFSTKKIGTLAVLLASMPYVGFSQTTEQERQRLGKVKKSRTTLREQGGRQVAITEYSVEEGRAFRANLERIAEARRATLRQQAEQRALAQETEEPLIQKSFVVTAAVLEDQKTYFECWPTQGGPSIKGYSNCNWNHFMGQQTFQDGNVQYTFLLLPTSVPSNASEEDASNPRENQPLHSAPESLPQIVETGARYMIIEGNENDQTLDFLDSIHERYDREKRVLIRTFRQRRLQEAERRRQLRINPPKPKNIEIRFGRIEAPAQNNPRQGK